LAVLAVLVVLVQHQRLAVLRSLILLVVEAVL
jgi:hypothetical protein